MRKTFLFLAEQAIAFAAITFIILFIRAIKSNDIDFAIFFGMLGLIVIKFYFKFKTD